MLLYCGDLASAIRVCFCGCDCSKALLTVKVNNAERHFLNPSNTGIAVTVLLFPLLLRSCRGSLLKSLSSNWSSAFAVIVIVLGTYMNWYYAKRMPLILALGIGFCDSGVIRCLINGLR